MRHLGTSTSRRIIALCALLAAGLGSAPAAAGSCGVADDVTRNLTLDLAAVSSGLDCEAGGVASFQNELRRRAHEVLSDNRRSLIQLHRSYTSGRPGHPLAQRKYEALRDAIRLDRALATEDEATGYVQFHAHYLATSAARRDVPEATLLEAGRIRAEAEGFDVSHIPTEAGRSFAHIQGHRERIARWRADLRAAFPALTFLDTRRINPDQASSTELLQALRAGLSEALEAIDRTRTAIDNGDFPLLEMQPLLDPLLDALPSTGDCAGDAVRRWIAGERRKESTIRWGGVVVPVVLGVGAFFVSGPAGLFLGLAGAATGAAAAGWELERAMDLYDGARAGRGGVPIVGLTADEARLGVFLAGVDTVLVVADLGLSARAVSAWRGVSRLRTTRARIARALDSHMEPGVGTDPLYHQIRRGYEDEWFRRLRGDWEGTIEEWMGTGRFAGLWTTTEPAGFHRGLPTIELHVDPGYHFLRTSLSGNERASLWRLYEDWLEATGYSATDSGNLFNAQVLESGRTMRAAIEGGLHRIPADSRFYEEFGIAGVMNDGYPVILNPAALQDVRVPADT